MKTLLLAFALFSVCAHASDPVCKNRSVTVMVKTELAEKLVQHVTTIDSIPLAGSVLRQTDENAVVEIHVIDDLGEGGHDAFDVAQVLKAIRSAEKDGMGIRRIMADVCFRDKASQERDPGDGDSGNVGTIGHGH